MATLLEAFRKATAESNAFDEYIEYYTKYIRVLIAGGDAQMENIRENSPLTPENLESFDEMCMTLTHHYQNKVKALKVELLELLKDIDLHKCKVMSYTEFDMIEWHLDQHQWNDVLIKFRPKGVAVSFWVYKAEDIEYNF